MVINLGYIIIGLLLAGGAAIAWLSWDIYRQSQRDRQPSVGWDEMREYDD